MRQRVEKRDYRFNALLAIKENFEVKFRGGFSQVSMPRLTKRAILQELIDCLMLTAFAAVAFFLRLLLS
jgi:hypothetical protein